MVGVEMKHRSEDTLDAVRVEIEGPTASFRYAHFLIGRQPTYPMPPPSTVYGMIAGALGNYPDPDTVRFAYRFACARGTVDDIELIWFTEPNTSTRGKYKDYVQTSESNILPREWLVQPRMTLYLTGSNLNKLYEAFRTPRYLPVLGRSQDIVSYRRVDQVQLERRPVGRFDESLLPAELRNRIRYGTSINFPRFINPHNRNKVEWDWFVAMDQSIPVGPNELFEPELGEEFWADPDTEDPETGRERLLMFHTFRNSDAKHSGSQG